MSSECKIIEDHIKSMLFQSGNNGPLPVVQSGGSSSSFPDNSEMTVGPVVNYDKATKSGCDKNDLILSDSAPNVQNKSVLKSLAPSDKLSTHKSNFDGNVPSSDRKSSSLGNESVPVQNESSNSQRLSEVENTVLQKSSHEQALLIDGEEGKKLKKRKKKGGKKKEIRNSENKVKNVLKRESQQSKDESRSSSSITPPKPMVFLKHKEIPELPSSLKEFHMTLNNQGDVDFKCDFCDLRSSEPSIIAKHKSSSSHIKHLKQRRRKLFLCYIPDPIPEQTDSITDLILRVHKTFGIHGKELMRRKDTVAKINQLINENISGCSIEMVGSSASGFGLESSNLDMVLKVPEGVNQADMLDATFKILKQDHFPTNVCSIFNEKVPRIQFSYYLLKASCNITLDVGHAIHMKKLLYWYSHLDERVLPLGTALRDWAYLCEIDSVDTGTLNSFCYVLLLIYFLQRIEPPVLPVVNALPDHLDTLDVTKIEEDNFWKSENRDSIGTLWVKLLKFYSMEYVPGHDIVSIRTSKKLSCDEKHWGTKFLAIEDPFMHRNLAHVIPNKKVFMFIQDCFLKTYCYFAHPQLQNKESISLAWYGKVPSKTISNYESEVQVTDNGLTVADYLEDQDQDLVLDDVISTIANFQLNKQGESFLEDLNFTSLEPDVKPVSQRENKQKDSGSFSPETSEATDSSISCDQEPTSKHTKSSTASDVCAPELIKVFSDESEVVDFLLMEVDLSDMKGSLGWHVDGLKIEKENFDYHFHWKFFKNPEVLPQYCHLCQQTNHTKNCCPEEALPPIKELPAMNKTFLNILKNVCLQIVEMNKPNSLMMMHRDRDCTFIESFIQKTYKDAKLTLFGSFCNGFGFCNSDMDFCLTFKNNADGKGIDHAEIIKVLAQKLEAWNRLRSVQPIVSAKVPIVKFFDTCSTLECDISLYNTLAVHNTELLRTYCEIDDRVQIIGYVLKFFAKELGICDASRGSLSSYAYVLMALFFLQHRDPPVIPVLQELHEGEKPTTMIDGCNVWFFRDISRLQEVWPHHRKNTESVAELWLGLLSFYAFEFDMMNNVICIRQFEPLSRFRKLWNSTRLTIEDPFDLNHNLGSGLSRKMNCYIVKAFIRSREHFGTPVSTDVIHDVHDNAVNYLFDRNRLTNGMDPPNDRGCRRCGRIGHIQKNCPLYERRKVTSQNVASKKNSPVTDMQQQPRNYRRIPGHYHTPYNNSPPIQRHMQDRPKPSKIHAGPPPSSIQRQERPIMPMNANFAANTFTNLVPKFNQNHKRVSIPDQEQTHKMYSQMPHNVFQACLPPSFPMMLNQQPSTSLIIRQNAPVAASLPPQKPPFPVSNQTSANTSMPPPGFRNPNMINRVFNLPFHNQQTQQTMRHPQMTVLNQPQTRMTTASFMPNVPPQQQMVNRPPQFIPDATNNMTPFYHNQQYFPPH